MAAPQQAPETASRSAIPAALALGVGLLRLVPHPWNFTPMGGVGLFSGSRVGGWFGLVLPVALMAVTDLLHWALRGPDYSPFHVTRAFVYPCILLYALIGRMVAARDSAARVGLASVLGSAQFFLLTNLGSWLFGLDAVGTPYPKTLDGLAHCYAAALPFLGGTVLGDLIYSTALFGVYAVVTQLAGARQAEMRAEPEA